MFLTNISLKRPVFATVVILGLLAIGISSLFGLGMNDMPETHIPYVAVSLTLQGASPDQMESKVTKPVEEAVGQISGVKHISSTINEGQCTIGIEFADNVSVDSASQDVRSKINGIRASLPSDMDDPVIQKIDPNSRPILSLAVSGGNLSQRDMSDLVNNTIVPQFNTVSGVGSITTYGIQDREIEIKLDKEKLAAYNLTTDQVLNSLKSDNIDSSSGNVSGSSREISLRTYSGIKNVDDFNNILLATRNGTEIRVRDVAQVVDSFKDVSSLSYYDGQECAGIDIVKQSDTNTVTVANSLKAKMSEIQKTLPTGVNLQIVDDNSTSIRNSVNNVRETLVEGCLLAVLVVFLFLRSAASTAISAIALPTSIVTSFAALKFMNFTLNTMTLMALSLAVGLLIDDSIVVVENISRNLHLGKSPIEAAIDGTREISLAVMAATLTVVAVFLPMANMSGMLGSFFKEFGLTIVFSVLISLFVSFTLVPLLSSRYVRDEELRQPKTFVGRFLKWFNHLFDKLAKYYQMALAVVLNHRKKTILITIALLVLSLGLLTQMSVSFQPSQDKAQISISANLDSGLTMDAANQKAQAIEKIVNKYPDVLHVYTTVTSTNVSVSVDLTDKNKRKQSADQIAHNMRAELQQIPGLDLSVSGSSSGGMGSSKSFAMHIKGENFNDLLDYCQKAKQLINTIPGAVDVGINYKAGKPETQIVVDRDKAADLGVSASTVSSTLATMFNGSVVGQYTSGNDRYDIKVRLQDDQRTNMDSVDGIYLSGSDNAMIPLDQLTKKVYTTSSSTIYRYDKSREIQIQANNDGITSGALNTAVTQKLMKELPYPNGISNSAGGDQATMQESVYGLIQALVLGILFVFLILAAQFESFIDPLSIMFSLPLAIIGALIALYISGSGLSMVGGIGIIFLLGLVTKNAILLVDFIKQDRAKGYSRREAILAAGLTRLRPIMMTTLAMIFGMLPAVLATSTGSEMRRPMAIAIVGGLISSTLLTLLVVPVVYTILDDLRGKFIKQQADKAAESIASE